MALRSTLDFYCMAWLGPVKRDRFRGPPVKPLTPCLTPAGASPGKKNTLSFQPHREPRKDPILDGRKSPPSQTTHDAKAYAARHMLSRWNYKQVACNCPGFRGSRQRFHHGVGEQWLQHRGLGSNLAMVRTAQSTKYFAVSSLVVFETRCVCPEPQAGSSRRRDLQCTGWWGFRSDPLGATYRLKGNKCGSAGGEPRADRNVSTWVAKIHDPRRQADCRHTRPFAVHRARKVVDAASQLNGVARLWRWLAHELPGGLAPRTHCSTGEGNARWTGEAV
jgi:hypothetical protein